MLEASNQSLASECIEIGLFLFYTVEIEYEVLDEPWKPRILFCIIRFLLQQIQQRSHSLYQMLEFWPVILKEI